LKPSIVWAALFLSMSAGARAQPAPLADHHQHLFSPAVAALISPAPPAPPTQSLTADELLKLLDEAGIRRAAVLSVGYIWGGPARVIENEYDKVKAENDWVSQQVGRHPERLRGFCGVNPLEDYALGEIARCAKDPHLRYGLKLHIGNSVVNYHNVAHIAQLRRVFAAANANRMAIVVHMRASISQKVAYGADEATIFLNELLPVALDIPVQIAHLAGAGGYSDPLADQALSVFVDAIAKGDPRTKQLWFDVTTNAVPNSPPEQLQQIAQRVRQLGVGRVLYGSDAAGPTNRPRDGWAAFLKVPLTPAEFETIAQNVPPYMR
jgi:uncharacterized protein